MDKNKSWFFYNEKGEVYLIYVVEPPKDLLEGNNVLEGVEGDVKEGYNIEYKVDIKAKELKINYVKKAETTEEKIEKIQAKNNKLSQAIDQLLLMNLN